MRLCLALRSERNGAGPMRSNYKVHTCGLCRDSDEVGQELLRSATLTRTNPSLMYCTSRLRPEVSARRIRCVHRAYHGPPAGRDGDLRECGYHGLFTIPRWPSLRWPSARRTCARRQGA